MRIRVQGELGVVLVFRMGIESLPHHRRVRTGLPCVLQCSWIIHFSFVPIHTGTRYRSLLLCSVLIDTPVNELLDVGRPIPDHLSQVDGVQSSLAESSYVSG